ncbi:hypothetical protein ACFYNO_13575 [Kitasatospora sp. NPDC006697]|uniref:hypothetical protein n=1 Tax=Kitasatospora sp. NPDC006697 TaxID=3364020 RepID=UPI0036A0F9D5
MSPEVSSIEGALATPPVTAGQLADAAALVVAEPAEVGPVADAAVRRAPEPLVRQLNLALRRPADFGGAAVLPLLLDELAWAEQRERGVVWLPDEMQRFDAEAELRGFDDAQGHVLAAQYGEEAHRRGWLRPDRLLTAEEHAAIAAELACWQPATDPTLDQMVDRFGEPSVVFGGAEPGRPRTLGYVSTDREAELIRLVFDGQGVLLAFHPAFEGFVCGTTPRGLLWQRSRLTPAPVPGGAPPSGRGGGRAAGGAR